MEEEDALAFADACTYFRQKPGLAGVSGIATDALLIGVVLQGLSIRVLAIVVGFIVLRELGLYLAMAARSFAQVEYPLGRAAEKGLISGTSVVEQSAYLFAGSAPGLILSSGLAWWGYINSSQLIWEVGIYGAMFSATHILPFSIGLGSQWTNRLLARAPALAYGLTVLALVLLAVASFYGGRYFIGGIVAVGAFIRVGGRRGWVAGAGMRDEMSDHAPRGSLDREELLLLWQEANTSLGAMEAKPQVVGMCMGEIFASAAIAVPKNARETLIVGGAYASLWVLAAPGLFLIALSFAERLGWMPL